MVKILLSTVLLTCLLFQFVSAQQSYPPTLTVAQDGSGDYKTIQAAINSVRDLGERRVQIYIRKGTYNEKLVIPSWKTNISLIGESPESTIITGNDYSGKAVEGGAANLLVLILFYKSSPLPVWPQLNGCLLVAPGKHIQDCRHRRDYRHG